MADEELQLASVCWIFLMVWRRKDDKQSILNALLAMHYSEIETKETICPKLCDENSKWLNNKDVSTDIEISSCLTRIVLLSLLWCFQEHQTYGIRKVIDETTRSGQNHTRAKIGRGSADDIRTILASGRNKTFLQGLSSWTIDNCGKGVFESLQQLLTRMLRITEFLITQCASSTQRE